MKTKIIFFCKKVKPTENDTTIIFGDVGANYYGVQRVFRLKATFAEFEPKIFVSTGNTRCACVMYLHTRQKNSTAV